jgi:CheY-like chemotaxis protein
LRHDGKEPGWLSIKTCLVVDASDVVRKVARHSFQSFKFDSREADTGQAALDACQAAMPDAILLARIPVDLARPAQRRQAARHLLRHREQGRDIALVLSSGAAD